MLINIHLLNAEDPGWGPQSSHDVEHYKFLMMNARLVSYGRRLHRASDPAVRWKCHTSVLFGYSSLLIMGDAHDSRVAT